MDRNVRHIRPSRLNTPKIFLWLVAIVIIVLGFYTIKTIIGPNYDSKYSEMLNAGEIINPAVEYVGVLSSGVLGFVQKELETSKFLDFGQEDASDIPEMDNPLDKYDGPPVEDTTDPVAEDGEEYVENPPVYDIEDPVEDEEDEVEGVVVKEEDKKDMLKYILILIKAYNLHNPPFSSETPKIEMNMDGEIFNAEVIKGEIYIDGGRIDGKDIIIHSTWNEAVIMSEGLDEIKESFSSGSTLIEQVCDDKVCFLKGYKEVYDEINS